MSTNHINPFAATLLEWHTTIDRKLPWKESKDPYKIWLSEIIMQQTRIAQGTPYYLKFVEAFPTVIELANADEEKVMKLWQGLGYYSRARNLHFTAKLIRDNFDGIFPTRYEDIIALKGIGEYTAAAISSFAYDLEYPVVDGNVIRLISRYFGITAPVDVSQTLKEINVLARKLIKGANPGDYNQAIMDFGALMCSPKSPNCQTCPLNADCKAYTSGLVDSIPFKSKKIKKKDRCFHYVYISDEGKNVILNQRRNKDIWQSLFDFPVIENNQKGQLSDSQIQEYIINTFNCRAYEIVQPVKTYKHILTHQTIYAQFYKATLAKVPEVTDSFTITHEDEIESFALPVLLSNFLKDQDGWTLF